MCWKKMLYSLKVKLKSKTQVTHLYFSMWYVSFYILIESLFISTSQKIVILTFNFSWKIFLFSFPICSQEIIALIFFKH